MPNFELIVSKNVSGLNVSLYNFDLEDLENKSRLESELIAKIRSMKIHEKAESYKDCIPQNILDEYKDAFNKRITEINPVNNRAPSQPHFSAKRSRVTEFLAQMVLAKKEFCIFYDETDKKILTSSLEDSAHASGIDITGIKNDGSDIKFIACELKASKEADIPCSSAEEVFNDLKKAYNDEKLRLSKEIQRFLTTLKSAYDNDDDIKSILSFLYKLLASSANKAALLEKVLFIPFLIRKNENIITDQNLNDFENYNPYDFVNANIKGLILSFNTDVTDYAKMIYDKAIENE